MASENVTREQCTDPDVVRAYLRTELGRATLRRQLVECAQVKRGQQALLPYDAQRLEGIDEVAVVAAEILRNLGVKLIVMQVDELIPRDNRRTGRRVCPCGKT